MAVNLTQKDRKQITDRVKQLASEIDDIARTARTIDPSNGFSYAAMCGGFGAVLIGLARDLAGEDAEQMVRKAIERAYASEQEGGAA